MPRPNLRSNVKPLTNEDVQIWVTVAERHALKHHRKSRLYTLSVDLDTEDHAQMHCLSQFGRAPGQTDWIDF